MLGALALALLVAWIFADVGSFGWVTFDDPVYVIGNEHVRRGLTWEGVRWAFTTGHGSNWHPVTWLSHMLDVELHGTEPGGHHVTSAVLHALNAVLTLLLLARATGAFWRSWLVAALFAAHPLHVESVAWVAERKDVLSAAFGLLTGLAWLRYVRAERAGARWSAYAAALVAYALGLMAKPMLVSLPLVMLLADAWPLERLRGAGAVRRALVEKLPFVALAAASSVVTALVQHAGRAMEPGMAVALPGRALNALVAYARYLVMTVWPADLAVLYPHPALPGGTPLETWRIAGAAVLLAGLTVLCVRARRLGWPLVGWLGYLVTLLPVIGLVQVGSQALADRYTYLPLTGAFVLVAWSAGELVRRRPPLRAPLVVVAAAAVALCAFAARAQARVWRDVETLYERALEVAPRMPVLLVNVAVHHRQQGRVEEAVRWYERALDVDPDFVLALFNLGVAHHVQGDLQRAEPLYRRAIELDPRHVKAHYNLAAVLDGLGRPAEAAELRRRAAGLAPELAAGLAPGPAAGPGPVPGD